MIPCPLPAPFSCTSETVSDEVLGAGEGVKGQEHLGEKGRENLSSTPLGVPPLRDTLSRPKPKKATSGRPPPNHHPQEPPPGEPRGTPLGGGGERQIVCVCVKERQIESVSVKESVCICVCVIWRVRE